MKTKRIAFNTVTLAILFLVMFCTPVFAQTPETQIYRLDIDKNFGSALGADISGVFTLSVVGPDDLTSVSYFIDGELMMEVTEAPFEYQFNTDQYAFGAHALTALIKNGTGGSYTTVARTMNFMSQKKKKTLVNQKILPFILVLVGIVIVGRLIFFGSKRKPTSNNVEYGS